MRERSRCKEQQGCKIKEFLLPKEKKTLMLRKSFDCAGHAQRQQSQNKESVQGSLQSVSNKFKIYNSAKAKVAFISKKKILSSNLMISGQSLQIKRKLNQKQLKERELKKKKEMKRISCLQFAKLLLQSKEKLNNSVSQLNYSRKKSEEEIQDDKQFYQIIVKKSETPTESKEISSKIYNFHKSHSVQPRKDNQSDKFYYIDKLYKHKINMVGEEETQEVKIFREHFVQTFAVLQYFNKMNINEATIMTGVFVNLEKPKQKENFKTLVLDLDETLIHFHNKSPISLLTKPYSIYVTLPDSDPTELFVSFRPGLHQFLSELSKLYEIIIFTASFKEYAKQIIKYFEEQVVQESGLYDEILARTECQLVQGQFYVKDLRCLLQKDRTINNIVIVDNSCYSFALQLDNGVPCIPYYGDDNDKELYSLLNYLKQLAQVDDVREVNRKTFHLSQLVYENNVESAYKNICQAIEQQQI